MSDPVRGSAGEDAAFTTAELLFRVQTEALISVLGRKKSERYLRLLAVTLAQEESLSAVFQIRPSAQQAAIRRARLQAAEMFQRCLPTWLARLPEE